MQSIVLDDYQKIEDIVKELLGENEEILVDLEVFPLDHFVKDVSSPRIFLSNKKFILLVDSTIEVYNINEIRVVVFGGKPKFSLIEQILEFRPLVESKKTPLSKNIDIPDDWIRFAIYEGSVYPKSFVLRKDSSPLKGYQTWAFAQMLKNLQRGQEDFRIRNMLYGNFSFFDGFFLIRIFLIFLAYVLLTVIFGNILPNSGRMILDILFGIICFVVLGWVCLTIFLNIRKYRRIYEAYMAREASLAQSTVHK